MQKYITLTFLTLALTSCGGNPQKVPCGSLDCKTPKSYSMPLCKSKVIRSNDPLEVLLSDDPFNLYEDKVEIPHLPTPKSEELPTFKIFCI